MTAAPCVPHLRSWRAKLLLDFRKARAGAVLFHKQTRKYFQKIQRSKVPYVAMPKSKQQGSTRRHQWQLDKVPTAVRRTVIEYLQAYDKHEKKKVALNKSEWSSANEFRPKVTTFHDGASKIRKVINEQAQKDLLNCTDVHKQELVKKQSAEMGCQVQQKFLDAKKELDATVQTMDDQCNEWYANMIVDGRSPCSEVKDAAIRQIVEARSHKCQQDFVKWTEHRAKKSALHTTKIANQKVLEEALNEEVQALQDPRQQLAALRLYIQRNSDKSKSKNGIRSGSSNRRSHRSLDTTGRNSSRSSKSKTSKRTSATRSSGTSSFKSAKTKGTSSTGSRKSVKIYTMENKAQRKASKAK